MGSHKKSTRCILMAALALMLAFLPILGRAQNMNTGIMSPPASVRPPGLSDVGIQQNLDAQIPPELTFRDETGKAVHLADYFGKKPMILNLVYYQCPMLCDEVLSGLTGALKAMQFQVGREFDVLTVSFDPRETPQLASEKKAEILKRYGRSGGDTGWHFLTGPQESITALTKAAGFQYHYDSSTGQFAHSTAILVLTPAGKIAQYYYGVEFSPKDLRLAMVQASQEKIGTVVDQILLYCYHYDPATGRYGAQILRILRLAAVLTMLSLGILVFVMLRRDSTHAPPGAAQVH